MPRREPEDRGVAAFVGSTTHPLPGVFTLNLNHRSLFP
jgi:hypothetical protein